PPGTAAAGAISLPVQVVIQDAFGNTVPTATHSVTVAIRNNPSGGTLSGTTTATAANGVATFSDLSIDKPGTGYTLAVSAGGLTDATSTAFNIVAPLTFTAVAAGGAGQGSHTCGVTTDGAIYCWGFNGRGQLGDGTHTDRFVPTLVQGPAGVTFQAVSAGGGDVHNSHHRFLPQLRPRNERGRALLGRQRVRPAGRQHHCRQARAGPGWRSGWCHLCHPGRRVRAYLRRDASWRRVLLGR